MSSSRRSRASRCRWRSPTGSARRSVPPRARAAAPWGGGGGGGGRGGGGASGPAGGRGPPPFYYLTVRGDHSNPETAYQIRAAGKLLVPDREVEPNDTPETATVMADRKSLRAHWSTGD